MDTKTAKCEKGTSPCKEEERGEITECFAFARRRKRTPVLARERQPLSFRVVTTIGAVHLLQGCCHHQISMKTWKDTFKNVQEMLVINDS